MLIGLQIDMYCDRCNKPLRGSFVNTEHRLDRTVKSSGPMESHYTKEGRDLVKVKFSIGPCEKCSTEVVDDLSDIEKSAEKIKEHVESAKYYLDEVESDLDRAVGYCEYLQLEVETCQQKKKSSPS